MLNSAWREPKTQSIEDREAAQMSLEFQFGWFGHPIHFGKYPDSMVERIPHLPKFTEGLGVNEYIIMEFQDESKKLKGSVDFLGVNHYTTRLSSPLTDPTKAKDFHKKFSQTQEFVDPKYPTNCLHWPVVPWGINKLIHWVAAQYQGVPLYITENGFAQLEDEKDEKSLQDDLRVEYLRDYINEVGKCVKEGIDVRGYFVW